MKKILALTVLCFAAATGVWAQKADVSYWSGMPRYKTYEPWYYEVVQENRRKTRAVYAEHLRAVFGADRKGEVENIRRIRQNNTRARTLARLYQLAGELQIQNDTAFIRKYIRLQHLLNKNPLFQDYAILVKENAQADVNLLSEESFALLETLFGSAPEERAKRPEPVFAQLADNHFILLEFKTAEFTEREETVHVGIDLSALTVEIYKDFPHYDLKAGAKTRDLMDVPDFRKTK